MSPLGTAVSARERVERAFDRLDEVDRPDVWITLRDRAGVRAEAESLDECARVGARGPLHGLLVAVKDNIDVAGLPTTAACPTFVRRPEESAPVVTRLVEQGAIVLGKTNLDQFATGLTGCRSPYGVVSHAVDPDRIAGGSSSGSAVAVALGVVDVALGTDTAGSGRVPAALQGVVGLKPTIGTVPVDGVVPASRSYDCVSVVAPTVDLAEQVAAVVAGPTARSGRRPRPAAAPARAPARPRLGVPDAAALAVLPSERAEAFAATVGRLARRGVGIVPVDLAPFRAAGDLMYGGALVAERYAAVGTAVEAARAAGGGAADPSVAAIVTAAADVRAHALVADLERLDGLAVAAREQLSGCDALLVPTVSEHPTLAEVAADPLGVNTRLGRFTTFVNLLDMAAVAVPSGSVAGLPVGVTVAVPAFADAVAADLARLVAADA